MFKSNVFNKPGNKSVHLREQLPYNFEINITHYDRKILDLKELKVKRKVQQNPKKI